MGSEMCIRDRLNRDAVPSKFSWTPVKEEEEEDVERTAVSKLERSRIEQNEATDTASEGEGDELRVSGITLTSQKTQTYEDDFCDKSIDISLKFILPNLDRNFLSTGIALLVNQVLLIQKNFSKKMKVIWRRTGMTMNLKSGKPKQELQRTSFRLRMNL